MEDQGHENVKKRYDPRDATISFVERDDEIDPLSDAASLRAEMSCGHAATPDSLTGWCRNLLEQGQYTFRCPALKGDQSKCDAVWPYQEVRRMADLSVEEMHQFEEDMARLAASEYCETQQCPECKTCVERSHLTNLCVKCVICTADKKKTYQFCWQCLKPWKGKAPRSDCCDNEGCTNKDLELLRICKTTDLPEVEGASVCPSVRLCPTCGLKVEHNRKHCKNIHCPRCRVDFCFVCLKPKRECSQTSSPYKLCSSGVAPRQTAIPVWRR